MIARWTIAFTLAFSAVVTHPTLSAQFMNAYLGPDHLAHVVDQSGNDRAIAKETDQVGIGTPRLSPDRRFAAWTVEVANCCTSYPIPLSVSIVSFASARPVTVGDGLMIYNWCFVPGKAQVAISSGTVHGWTGGQNLHLYSAASGALITSWSGSDDAKRPPWAMCLQTETGNSE